MKNEPTADILASASQGGDVEQSAPVAEELVEPGKVFHAPVATSLIDALLGSYQAEKARMRALCDHLQQEGHDGALAHLIAGNAVDLVDYAHGHSKVSRLMNFEGGVKSLNSTYWQRALSLTDVLEAMPQARRSEWGKMIREFKAPDFEEDTVRSTMLDLLNSRNRFFAERVDGIFRQLSKEHITNSPQGFSKRMIIAGLLNCYGSIDHEVVGYISDLRNVVARFMGSGESDTLHTNGLVKRLLQETGQWKVIDGGALRIKLFKKGTAHLEVHPDMAWRLNAQLAALYPAAIPSEFRKAPKKRNHDFPLLQKTIHRHILSVIGEIRVCRMEGQFAVFLRIDAPKMVAQVEKEVGEILTALGGCEVRAGRWNFDYDPTPIFADLLDTGVMPDERAHQLYETPEDLAEMVADEAAVEDGDTILEPSAGRGGIATQFPAEQTTCVEVSKQNCKILEAKGYKAIQADFLAWAEAALGTGQRYSVIAMNPPWANGRAELHTKAAARLAAPGGRLVAVLPGSLINRLELPGFELRWSQAFHRRFATTDVSAHILTAVKVSG